MGKIKVYFNNGNTGIFDRDKAIFKARRGVFLDFGRDDRDEQLYADMLDRGPVVNWDAVSWVRAYTEEEENA